MREQFENLPEIAKILKDEDTHWCNKRNMYVNQRVFQDSTTGYLNGAYYAFQEQQKTIVKYEAGLRKNKANKHKLLAKNIELQKKIDAVLHCIAQSELHQDRAIWGLQDEIKEILK